MTATGPDASTKLGAYLSLGCITPRQIHTALEASEREWTSNGPGPKENGQQSEVAALEAGALSLKLHLQIRFSQTTHPLLHSPQILLSPCLPSQSTPDHGNCFLLLASKTSFTFCILPTR